MKKSKSNIISKTKPISVYNLIFLLLFQAVSAVGGGAVLLIDPSGNLMHMPASNLSHSPFSNYLIPGLFLFFILGIIPLFICLSIIWEWKLKFPEKLSVHKDMQWEWNFSVYIGLILIIWIDIEILAGINMSLLQSLYSLIGVLIVVFALMPKAKLYFQNKEK